MKHCLIVDDSRVVRTVARRILEDLSYSVAEAGDGMTALRACRESMPDLILLDWNLPSMKGLDFVKSVRGQQQGSLPVILFCATESDPADIANAIAAGANDYVMKPFDGVDGAQGHRLAERVACRRVRASASRVRPPRVSLVGSTGLHRLRSCSETSSR